MKNHTGKEGEKVVNKGGYVDVSVNGRWVSEHRRIAENAIGKPLPAYVQVHHVNEIKTDNRPENLVICGSGSYHRLLHLRMDALANSGNPNYRKCSFCKQWDDPKNMEHTRNLTGNWHRSCINKYALDRYYRKKNERTDNRRV